MADDKVALSIEIEADRAQMSLGELEAGYKGLREQLEGTNRRTEAGRKEFKRLSTQMAQASKEIKNLELGFEGLDREQVASELGSVAGAVGDLTTSFVILGGESETMEQVGRNIEKAIMISMGLKGAIEGISSASKLWTNVLKQSEAAQQLLTLATKGWGKALIATGIGAIIALVATLITKWDELTVAIGMATKEQKLNNDIAQEAIDKVGDEISASDKLQKTLNDESISREEKNKAIIELQDEYPNLLSNIDAEKDSLEDINKALELNTKLIMLRAEQEAIASLRADELKEKTKAQIEAQTGVNKGLFEEAVALVTVFEAEDFATAATNKQIAANEKQIEVLDKLADAKQKEIDALLEAGAVGEDEVNKEAERQKEAERIAKERAERRAQRLKDQQEADKKAFEERKARRDIELIETKEFNEEMYIEEEEKTYHILNFMQLIQKQKAEEHEKELARIEAERQARLAATQERLESASQIIGAIGSLNSAALATDLKNAGDNEKKKEQLRKASFEREKKLNIAMALVNGAQAQMSILAQTPKADFGIATAIAMAAAAVTTIAQIAAIKATSYQGGGSPAASESATAPSAGGAGAAGGGAAITPVSNTSTILGGQQVFVTETDITETQNNVSVIEESATF
jgi:hypothetical protein